MGKKVQIGGKVRHGIIVATIAAGAVTTGCAGMLGGSSSSSSGSASASASGSVSLETGFFFGHDLRHEESIVYVLDLSGSMSGESGSVVENAGTDAAGAVAGGLVGGFAGRRAGSTVKRRIKRLKKKIEKVKLHLMASLAGLPDGSEFNVVLFANGVQKLAPGMILANGATKLAVSAFVDRLEEGGGTNMYQAVEASLFSGATHIILLTDGLPTSSTPDEILQLVQRHNGAGEIKVSTVGVGGDQAFEFLNLLAQENNGTFASYN